ncbi:MAG: hypothetical protein AABW56_03630 [Nanoarchaeota archaeon]
MGLENMIRVIPHRTDNAAMSLAIDMALFEMMNNQETKTPIFRTYQFSKPTVVFGSHQSLKNRYNPDVIKNVDLVRRDTGGGHLYFEPEDLHFSFISPLDFYDDKDLIFQYHKVNSYIVKALKNLGHQAYLGRTSVRINKKILVGSARKHGKYAALHQGVILHTKYNEDIFKLLMARDDEIKRWDELIMPLQNNNQLDITKELKSIISPIYEKNLEDNEIKLAMDLYNSKYTNSDFINTGEKDEDICLIALEWTKDDDKK